MTGGMEEEEVEEYGYPVVVQHNFSPGEGGVQTDVARGCGR